jgi:hypothetical protein
MHGDAGMTFKSLASGALPLLTVLAGGCETTVHVDGGGGTGGGEGGSGGANPDPECVPFHDQDGDYPLTFRVRNNTGVDVYLPGVCDLPMFHLEEAAGQGDTFYGNRDTACLQTCEELQSEEPYACTAGACAPTSFRIPIGATMDIPWNGTGLRSTSMPAKCAEDGQTTSCTQIVAADAGRFSFAVDAYSSCGEGCACEPSGLCSGEATGLQAFVVPITFDYPTPVVELVLEVCAFGCAGG